MSQFVHLNVHSEYSIDDGIIKIDQYLKHAKELGYHSIALTDHANLFAYTKFFHKAINSGLHPIIGADIYFSLDQERKNKINSCRLTLLAMNNDGLKNLFHLITNLRRGQSSNPICIQEAFLNQNNCDHIACIQSFDQIDISQQESLVKSIMSFFPGRHYIGVSRINQVSDLSISQTLKVASKYKLPPIAFNNVCFLKPEDFEAHEAKLCIQHGFRLSDQNRISYSEQQYLKDFNEMKELFKGAEMLLENAASLAKRCNVYLDDQTFKFPDFKVPKKFNSIEEYLKWSSKKGLENRLSKEESNSSEYQNRLAKELKVICEMGFAGYFLIVADFIDWSRKNDIPVGPGRGSGAGSLVAYALGIVDIDPIKFDLLFERFLNPERISMPDFDIDFCIEGRDKVIEYVAEKYGRENVSQIITFGTMAARAVVRDVGRVLGLSYGYVDRIAKLIPFEVGITIEKALEDSPELSELYETNEDVQNLIELSKKLEGQVRNAGTHAGGVVIAPKNLTEYMPLYFDEEQHILSQLDKDELEKIGLIKFDFLGLKTLTVIKETLRGIKKAHNLDLSLSSIELSHKQTFDLLKAGDTVGVFQLESLGMRQLVKKLLPDTIEDVIALIALFRPGPLQSGMVDDYVARKHGGIQSRGSYFDASLEEILESTYGVILYQEQVMQIAQIYAGYSLGSADILRRAMGKKKPKEMREQKQIFIDGAVKNGHKSEHAEELFEIIEKFAGYGFNKSHSAAYGLISYQTAYLKCNYRSIFLASSMSFDMDNTDKLIILINDAKNSNIAILPPNINTSEYKFSAINKDAILYGLGAIKGIGRNVVEEIIKSRESDGLFKSFSDFITRMVDAKLNKRSFESLIFSGSLDDFGSREDLLESLEDMLIMASSHAESTKSGQGSLFGLEEDTSHHELPLKSATLWTDRQKLFNEFKALGIYLSGHPFLAYTEFCKKLGIKPIKAHLENNTSNDYRQRKKVISAGMITDFRRRGSRLTLNIDDGQERIEVMLFEDTVTSFKELIEKGKIIIIEGILRYDDYLNANRITGEKLLDIDQIIESKAKRLTITLVKDSEAVEKNKSLVNLIKETPSGMCEVCIEYHKGESKAIISMGEEYKIKPNLNFREKLISMVDKDNFKFHFGKDALLGEE